jgi:periplasmic protein TonB
MGWFLPDSLVAVQESGGGARATFLAVGAAHLAALAALITIAPPERLIETIRPFAARVIELQPEKPPEIPKPPPPKKAAHPLPVLTSRAPVVESPVAFVVPQQPPAPLAPVAITAPPAPPAPVELPVVAARFDADYLDNPKPVYPHASRRLGEQGRVLLRVYVSAHGQAEKVEIKSGCGYERLDAAARDAVSRWRFTPARRGDQAIAAWVQVPITFHLES